MFIVSTVIPPDNEQSDNFKIGIKWLMNVWNFHTSNVMQETSAQYTLRRRRNVGLASDTVAKLQEGPDR